jgi:hypothetical protein
VINLLDACLFTSRSDGILNFTEYLGLLIMLWDSLAHASKAASEEVDKMFDKAVRELGKYEETFHPK